ncbi:MAG: type II toxin-antitoxin system RelB family antitoxin [Terriglobales bacterium]
MLTIRLPATLEKRLERLARRTGRTKSFYVKRALAEFLDDEGDYLIALARLEKRRASIPFREVRRRLQLKALGKAAGAWKDRDHPELQHGSAAWSESCEDPARQGSPAHRPGEAFVSPGRKPRSLECARRSGLRSGCQTARVSAATSAAGPTFFPAQRLYNSSLTPAWLTVTTKKKSWARPMTAA